ncbi:MAG: hypothetical protein ACYTFZ_04605 [Planctomycetota bacterium]
MSTKVKRVLFFVLAVSLLSASGTALRPLQGMRQRYDLTSEPDKGISPQLALATQVLGWGRGLIIDVIWIRMEHLKAQERFFELVQLADWACKLAPRFPQVWDIQSWNLAYNVSCKVPHLPDRWAWIRSAIELLRDDGIPKNPNSAMLYDRLAWIYFHKIGEQDDNAHMFYKEQFALLMHEVIGGEGDEETLTAFINAPRTTEELLQDQEVLSLRTECMAHGFDIAESFFEWYKRTPSVPVAVREILARPEKSEALRRIEVYARAKRLREEYGLDAARMLAMRKEYGPLDWRTAYPHAIYWARIGLERLAGLEHRTLTTFDEFGKEVPLPYDEDEEHWREGEKLYEFQRVTLKRIIYASIQSLVKHGRLLFDTKGRLLLEPGPDYRFADAALPLYEDVIEAHGMRFKVGTQDAYKYFLQRGAVEFHLMGDSRKARDYFALLREKFPEEVAGRTFQQYRWDSYKQQREDMSTAEARRYTAGLIMRGLLAVGANAEDKALVYEARAKEFVADWNREAEPNLRSRVRYNKLRESIIVDVLTGTYRIAPEFRANLIRKLDAKKDDSVVQKILANIRASEEELPETEKVGPQWKKETY